tara:strand:+ start:800 stop:1516 length:717 start_codon:yes stop_codon:yes gene_type:complete
LKNKLNFSITIILFEPQLDENIGAVARAMLNFNLSNLRIIKKGWKPNKVSIKNSAKADSILKNAKVFKSLEEGINDLNYVYATSNRKRDLSTKVVNLKEAVKSIKKNNNSNIGILFGPERSGLNNNSIALCDKIIEIPLNKKFNSLNLAQSVLLVAYELFNFNLYKKIFLKTTKAKKKQLFNFFNVLESYLEIKNFFNIKEKKQKMMINIKSIFNKADLTEKEIKIILGIIKNLVKKK